MIDTSTWKEVHLYDIFDIDMGNKMDRGKMSDGTIAFVGRTANNNGINARVGKVVNHEKYGTIEPYEKGCITLALGGSIGSCFIQEEPFYTSQNVAVLIPKTNQSDYALRFITSVITHSVLHGKYEAFTEELNKHIKTDFVISLPATSDGQLDWYYMESYMKAVTEESEKSLESLRKADNTKHLIDVSGWGEFRVGDLFDVSRPSSRSSQNYDEGDMPFVASGNFNNGVTAYLQPKDDNDYDEGSCITVSAVDGYAFYQKDRFLGRGGAGSSIMMLRNDNLNELNGKYICTLIRKACNDWEYSNMGNKDKLADTVIWLPITSTGEPDWQYMEDYMRIIMDKSEQIISDLQIGA